MAEFFFETDGNQQGPNPLEQLLARGLRAESLVWREGMRDWQRADTLAELAGLFQPTPPPPLPGYPQQPAQGYGPSPVGYAQPFMNGSLPTSGTAVTSMILGILALIPCLSWLVIPCAILAIAFGVSARGAIRRGQATGGGMATSGIVCGIISLTIIALIAIVALGIGLHLSRGGKGLF